MTRQEDRYFPISYSSIAINGSTVVAGADMFPVGNQGPGAAFVFSKPATGWANMTQTAELTEAYGATFDDFGATVGVSGNTIVVRDTSIATRHTRPLILPPRRLWANLPPCFGSPVMAGAKC